MTHPPEGTKRPRGRPQSPDARTPADQKRLERARHKLRAVELPADLLATVDRIAARDGDTSRAAVLARAVAALG